MTKQSVYLLIVLVLWGLIPILDKKGLAGESVSSSLGLMIRLVFAVLVVFPFWLKSPALQEEWKTISWKAVGLFAASGLISMVVAQYFYYEALKEKSVARLFPILFGGAPVVSTLLAWLFLGESISPAMGIGCFLIAIGSGLMFF